MIRIAAVTTLVAGAAAAACGSGRGAVAVAVAVADAQPPPPRAEPTSPAYEGITRCEPPAPITVPVAGFTEPGAPDARVQGSLDRNVIARPIRAHHAAFRACYEDLLAFEPDAEGTVTASFAIRADGTVDAVEINGFDPRLDACVCREMLAVQFPRFGSARFGRVQVSYPFTFRIDPDATP